MKSVRWYQSVTFRLVVVALLAAALIAPAVFIVQDRVVERARDRAVAEYVQASLEAEEAVTCIELQRRLSPPGRRAGRHRSPSNRDMPRLVFLDDDFASISPIPFEIPGELLAKLAKAGDWAAMDLDTRRHPIRAIVIQLDELVGCPYVVAVRPVAPDDARETLLLLVSIGTALAAGVGALVPGAWLARRIRQLAQRVEDSRHADRDVDIRMSGRDEIAALSRAFAGSRAELLESARQVQRSRETLEEHIAQTSHDLRTPLTVLQQRLHRVRSSTPDDDTKVALDAAMADVSYVSSLLGNLNIRSRLQESQMQGLKSESVDLCAMTERVTNRYQPLANARDVTLNFAVPENALTVNGDSTLLEQMVSNLLENAVKFVPGGGHVAVLLEVVEGGFAWLVRDSGLGIKPSHWTELRARGAKRGGDSIQSADGLGLQIAFEIADLHGFRMTSSYSEAGGFEIMVRG